VRDGFESRRAKGIDEKSTEVTGSVDSRMDVGVTAGERTDPAVAVGVSTF
jgi:hypothetical protein